MATIALTLGQIENAMAEAVAERGEDYTYPFHDPAWTLGIDGDCRYTVQDGIQGEDGWETTGDPTGPACLIGVVFHRLGVPLATLAGYEGENADGLIRGLVSDWTVSFETDEAEAAVTAYCLGGQEAQDFGRTWGNAQKRAVDALEYWTRTGYRLTVSPN